MTRRIGTEEEQSRKIADCIGEIRNEWRTFLTAVYEYAGTLKVDLEREDWESAAATFSLFKRCARTRTVEAARLNDKLLALKKDLAITKNNEAV